MPVTHLASKGVAGTSHWEAVRHLAMVHLRAVSSPFEAGLGQRRTVAP
jgi:hypothetical protein